ncbi:phosphate uptake regulator PhoU [Candidatus Micrarchaeota archaeon]|nr:phosphate uptake regulator PhoU [Candidatus Micrarchaeota archaeon]
MAEFRRVQKTGRSTYIVSLPKPWVEAKGVKKGDVVSLEENEDGSIQLSIKTERRLHAEIDADETFALRKTISAYIAGAQRIVLKGRNAPILAEQARQHLSAVDVIEEKKDEIALRVFATGHEFKLETLLKRMHAVVLSMFDLAEKAYTEDVYETISKREKEMNRLYTLTLRSMGSERGSSLFKFDTLIAKSLENIGDELEQYCRERPHAGRKVLEGVRELYEKNMNQFLQEKKDLKVEEEYEKELKKELDRIRERSALEWARLVSIAKYCAEIEETTEDVLAIKHLTEENK